MTTTTAKISHTPAMVVRRLWFRTRVDTRTCESARTRVRAEARGGVFFAWALTSAGRTPMYTVTDSRVRYRTRSGDIGDVGA